MKIGKKKIILMAVSVASAAAIALTAMHVKNSKNGKGGRMGPPGGPRQESAVSVRIQEAQEKVLHDYVIGNGEIESQSNIAVFADIGGKVHSVSVSLGSTVRKGDVIAQIDPSEPGAHFAKSPVYAPISGTITSTPKKVGTKILTSTEIATIGDVANLQVSMNVPERYVACLKTGLKADIVLEAYPDQIFKAYVSKISPVLDSASRTKEIIMNFEKQDDRINAGMFAKVKLFTQDYNGLVAVPETAVVENGGKFYLFTVDESGEKAVRNQITKGKSVDGIVQVKEGISAGDKVIVEGMSSIANGSRIHVIGSGIQKKPDEERPRPPKFEKAKEPKKGGEK